MTDILLDTHVWAWALSGDPRLSARAVKAIGQAQRVLVSPISLFEIGQQVRLGKWPQMEPFAEHLPQLLVEQGGQAAVLDPETCLQAATMDWAHRDAFDRIIAATALSAGLVLVSADTVFDALADRTGWVARVW